MSGAGPLLPFGPSNGSRAAVQPTTFRICRPPDRREQPARVDAVPRPSPPPTRLRAARSAEQAGAVTPYRDAALYDREYRGRRADVAFYRRLAWMRGGPILDLGCGTGRLLIPLLRDGHRVVGVDLSPSMLSRASARMRRLARQRRRAGLLLRADLRHLPLRQKGRFPLIVMAFH